MPARQPSASARRRRLTAALDQFQSGSAAAQQQPAEANYINQLLHMNGNLQALEAGLQRRNEQADALR